MNTTGSYEDYTHRIDCPVCGSEDHRPFLSIPYGRLEQRPSLDHRAIGLTPDTLLHVVECKGCGFVFVNPRVRPEHEPLIYNESKANKYRVGGNYNKIDEKFYRASRKYRCGYFSTLMEAIDYVSAEGQLSLFDYGCGFGHSMILAQALGIDAWGVDIDRKRLELCEAQGLKVCHPNDFTAKFPGVRADIVLWQSNIEHIADLPAGLDFIRDRCKPGAVLYVNGLTPATINIDRRRGVFHLAHFVEHINYFPLKTLDRFMGRAGFIPLGMKRQAVIQNTKDLFKHIAKLTMDATFWAPFWHRYRANFARFYRFDG